MTIKQLVLAGAASLSGLTFLTAATALAAPDGTSEEGAALFSQRCAGCHASDPDQPSYGGPNLAGVVGRPAASTQFSYSQALRNSGLTWTRESLDTFLTSPMTKVPGTAMVISLPDPGERHAVIEFLATTSANEQTPPP